MKRVSSALLLLVVTLAARPAGADEFKLEYVGEQPAWQGVLEPYQQLTTERTPRASLKGVPEQEGGDTWFLLGFLGDGDNRACHIVLQILEDVGEAVLLMDTDRDLDFSDETALVRAVNGSRVDFPPMEFQIEAGGKKSPYRTALALFPTGGKPGCGLVGHCHYSGIIDLDGKEYEAALVDSNMDGIFTASGWFTDNLFVAEKLGKTASIWDSSVRLVIAGERWHYLEPAPDCSAIRLLGSTSRLFPVRMNAAVGSVEVWSSRTGCITLEADDGAIAMPPGDYTWSDYRFSLVDENRIGWHFTVMAAGTTMPFTVTEGANRLELCLPLRFYLTACTRGDEVVFDLKLHGRDEEVLFADHGDDLFCPAFSIVDSRGQALLHAAFESG